MKKILFFIAFIAVLWAAVRILNRPPEAMNTPIEAATVVEFSESVLKTAAAIRDSRERNAFMDALGEIGLEAGMLKSGSALLTDLLAKCDGKTPREIIRMAREERAAKQQLMADRSAGARDLRLDGYHVRIQDDQIYLFPKPTEAELRRLEIVNSLRDIAMYRQHWMGTAGRNKNRRAGPSMEEIQDLYGWPVSSPRIDGAEFFYLEDGTAACEYEGKIYTLKSKELYGTNGFP
ncbi:MAG TPA: hypothetical protein ENN17_03010 [bacterium]|nr:hypothetical protein [bacterium]